MFQANNYKNGNITDACHGDSGGPAIRKINNKLYQIGIVSWGYDSNDNSYPGVYTRVMNYYKWINKIMIILILLNFIRQKKIDVIFSLFTLISISLWQWIATREI